MLREARPAPGRLRVLAGGLGPPGRGPASGGEPSAVEAGGSAEGHPLRKLIYSVASTLDGFIAGPRGEYDWIPEEPAIDWDAFLGRFDTVVMGRGTWEVVVKQGGSNPTSGMRTIVVSSTLAEAEVSHAELVREDPVGFVTDLKAGDGKAIWLMGGGVLFRTLLDAGVVDEVEIAVVPVLLGEGIPVIARGPLRVRLELRELTEYPSGIVLARYVVGGGG